MGLMNQLQFLVIVLTLLNLLSIISASASISDGIYDDDIDPGSGRHLLASKHVCPIKFEFQNYTIITSNCKAPSYPPNRCCKAFLKFACPFAKYLNDLSNDCATTMFSYINLYGKYPPGLFATICRKNGKSSLTCPAHHRP
ncbi:OLC1v1022363C1 [Oldenlandia corymbosa var. corymbosa]|uniref:OLC1v1022363C1 n=1 Tax=Oldenlandia corymbosa var. corymbosa TaxID=529605 RepID=A0AAV1BZA5_OLDCO|nr:OLC1v1022363C1 [Oldenlandia corymbosa var. corymbosa]